MESRQDTVGRRGTRLDRPWLPVNTGTSWIEAGPDSVFWNVDLE